MFMNGNDPVMGLTFQSLGDEAEGWNRSKRHVRAAGQSWDAARCSEGP